MYWNNLNNYLRERYGTKVYKLALSSGCSCPNRDGALGDRGCVFCDGAGAFAAAGDIQTQLSAAKARVAAKAGKDARYIAYFQSFTNTYAPVAVLESLYRQAIEPEEILGLSIGTRPDCLPDDVVELLAQINREKPVSVELGLQTVQDETAEGFNRGYKTEVYFDAVRRLKAVGIEVVTHIILGLPGETPEMMEETTRRVCEAGTDGVKFHLLHVLRGTRLEQQYREGKLACMSLPEYAAVLKRCLAQVPEHVVVHRITGDGAKKDLVAPMWSADKKAVLAYLQEYLKE